MPRPDRRTAANDRAAKVAKIQKKGASAERRRGALIWGAAIAVVALIVGTVVTVVLRESPSRVDLSAVQEYGYIEPAQHLTDQVEYEEHPPVGGPHHPAWWNCGIYEEEVPMEHAVHSLEHGTVWLTYQPDLPAEQLEVLTELGNQEYMLVSPVPDQDSPVVATAWGHQLELDTADERTLTAFIRQFKQGEQTPEPGAACTGGTVVDLVNRA